MVKVDKRTALKAYNTGKEVYLLPSKIRLDNPWMSPCKVRNSCGIDFDTVLTNFSYYNCNKETGLRINYYLD